MSREILVKSHRRLAMCSQSWGTWWAAVLIPSWTVSKVRESRVHCCFRDKSEGQVAAALGSVFTLEFTGKHADLKQGHSGENLLSFLASLLPPKGLETTANKSGRRWWRKREETEHAPPLPPHPLPHLQQAPGKAVLPSNEDQSADYFVLPDIIISGLWLCLQL